MKLEVIRLSYPVTKTRNKLACKKQMICSFFILTKFTFRILILLILLYLKLERCVGNLNLLFAYLNYTCSDVK
jgi:hypothetical protein